jgi:serine/threonine protein kinase
MIDKIVGNYRILAQIGSGGMGKVYRGVDIMLEREVAIKMLHAELSSRPDVVERFRTEAVTLARLNHPNIATLYSFFRHGEAFFMVMEYVPGKTLAALLNEAGALPSSRAVDLVAQALLGISHAHSNGIIHRDLKPANIMLTGTEAVKVMDFGIARALGSARLTRAGHTVGTIEYMSPEQVRGQEGDARSDVYSMGIVLYEALTGRVPFFSDSDYELMRQQIENTPDPPRVLAPHLPPSLENVVLKALGKDPASRYQSANSFREAVLNAAGMSMAAPPTLAVPPPARIARAESSTTSILRPANESPVAASGSGRSESVAAALRTNPVAQSYLGSMDAPAARTMPPASEIESSQWRRLLMGLNWIHYTIAAACILGLASIAWILMSEKREQPAPVPALKNSTSFNEASPLATKSSSSPSKAGSRESGANKTTVNPDSIPGVLPPQEQAKRIQTPGSADTPDGTRGGTDGAKSGASTPAAPGAKSAGGGPHELLRQHLKKDKRKGDR